LSVIVIELFFFPRRGLEVDGFFSSCEESVARTLVTDDRRSVGTQTDYCVPVERRIVKRTMLGPVKERVAQKVTGWTPSPPIDIPTRSAAAKRSPPEVENVWKALHSRPPPGKRVTVHKDGCGCFVCSRQRSTQAGGERGQLLAGALPSVVVAPA